MRDGLDTLGYRVDRAPLRVFLYPRSWRTSSSGRTRSVRSIPLSRKPSPPGLCSACQGGVPGVVVGIQRVGHGTLPSTRTHRTIGEHRPREYPRPMPSWRASASAARATAVSMPAVVSIVPGTGHRSTATRRPRPTSARPARPCSGAFSSRARVDATGRRADPPRRDRRQAPGRAAATSVSVSPNQAASVLSTTTSSVSPSRISVAATPATSV